MIQKFANKHAFYNLFMSILLAWPLSAKPQSQEYNNELLAHILQEYDHLDYVETSTSATRARLSEKEWTIMVYMAADNDLAPFGRRNLVQLANIGSNHRMNILVHQDTRHSGKKKTKRLFVEQNKLTSMNENEPATQQMDSGNPQTLIDFCGWAIKNYPAKHYMLVLWDHGTGIIDIGRPRSINTAELFAFNDEKNMLELDRSIPFLDLFNFEEAPDQRGICFDDSTGHYLTNQDLEQALKTISNQYLHAKKLDILAFDACLMAMLEVSNIAKDYVNYMVASEEVELGTGYNYSLALAPLQNKSMSNKEMAQHLVAAYSNAYATIHGEYTQSALDLTKTPYLEKNVDEVATLLIDAIKNQRNNSVREAIKTSRHKLLCTHFDEPSYIDLGHFYTNLIANTKEFKFNPGYSGDTFIKKLISKLNEGLELISNAVIANAVGKNLKQAQGISIYFPDRRIHNSYHKTKFAETIRWHAFIKQYLAA